MNTGELNVLNVFVWCHTLIKEVTVAQYTCATLYPVSKIRRLMLASGLMVVCDCSQGKWRVHMVQTGRKTVSFSDVVKLPLKE